MWPRFKKTSYTAAVGKQAIKKQLHPFEDVTALYDLFICLTVSQGEYGRQIILRQAKCSHFFYDTIITRRLFRVIGIYYAIFLPFFCHYRKADAIRQHRQYSRGEVGLSVGNRSDFHRTFVGQRSDFSVWIKNSGISSPPASKMPRNAGSA